MSKSELFGNMPDSMPKNNVMKNDFNWEVPVESIPLPSKGMIYSPESRLYNTETVQIKAMTAHEEDILSSQAYIKEGTVITELIRSCVSDKSINPEEMINGDRVALMIGIRVTGYGPEYKATATCSTCNSPNEITANLTNLPIKRLTISPVEEGRNEFTFDLPVTKKSVHFKFLTNKDDQERAITAKNKARILNSKTENNITSFLEQSIISVDGKTDRAKIKHFVQNMPAYDSRALRKFITDNEPGMDMKWNFECNSCGAHNSANLPITAEFFLAQ